MLKRCLPLVVAALSVACSRDDDETAGPGSSEQDVGPSRAGDAGGGAEPPVLTTERTLRPAVDQLDPPDTRNPSVPADRDGLLAEGMGDLVDGPGEPHVTVTPDGPPPDVGAEPKLLTRFAHVVDIQLADDESPSRVAQIDADNTHLFEPSAYRPQESYVCHVTNAIVKTINAYHSHVPLDFVLMGGDNADNAQENEHEWVVQLLTGADEIECDSGDDDDPVAGPGNDGKDPFAAEGLAMPWYWVTGNHDILQQGTLPITPDNDAVSVGTEAQGAVDWAQPGGPVVSGTVVADPRRRLLDRGEVMALVSSDDDGHGIGSEQVASGKANYHFDVEGTPLRFVVLDTAAETGGSFGLLRRPDVDGPIKDALDDAAAGGKWVILASHHGVNLLLDGAFAGTTQPDAVPAADWTDFLQGYPNVLFHFSGHTHIHEVARVGTPGGHEWWEITSAAVIDFPHQVRIVEIWDQDNGWIMLRATSLDFSVEDDPVAEEGRRLGVMDMVSGWMRDGRGDADDRNVEVWVELP